MTNVGLLKIVEESFLNVFKECSKEVDAFYDEQLLRHNGLPTYKRWLDTVRETAIFASFRRLDVTRLFTRLDVTPHSLRHKYKTRSVLRQSVAAQVSGTDPLPFAQKELLWDAIDRSQGGFLLLGEPGAGKTTILKYLATTCAEGYELNGRRVIPLYVSVGERIRRGRARPLWRTLIMQLRMWDFRQPGRALRRLFENGRVLVLLDGLDECEQEAANLLRIEIIDLRARFPLARWCVSARPYAVESGLPGFKTWEVLPLHPDDRASFVRRWFEAAGQAEKGDALLARAGHHPAVVDLGGRPLLLSTICALWDNDLELPNQEEDLLGRCVEGLLGGWAAFRGFTHQSVLGAPFAISQRRAIAASLAASCLERGLVVFDVREVQGTDFSKWAKQALRGVDLPPVDEILRTLTDHYGILVERAPGVFAFCAFSLQEYLTADHVIAFRREREMLQHSDDQLWRRVILLASRMLVSGAADIVSGLYNRADRGHHVAGELLGELLATTHLGREAYGRAVVSKALEALTLAFRGARLSAEAAGTEAKFAIELKIRGGHDAERTTLRVRGLLALVVSLIEGPFADEVGNLGLGEDPKAKIALLRGATISLPGTKGDPLRIQID